MEYRLNRLLLGLTLAIVPALAQTNAVKVTKLIFSVANLDKSVAFYRALGLRTEGQIGAPQPAPPFVLQMVGVPAGTRFRNAMLNFPGADVELELTEFSGMELHPGKPRIQDSGAALLIVVVRKIDAVLDRVKSAGATVVTPGGRRCETTRRAAPSRCAIRMVSMSPSCSRTISQPATTRLWCRRDGRQRCWTPT